MSFSNIFSSIILGLSHHPRCVSPASCRSTLWKCEWRDNSTCTWAIFFFSSVDHLVIKHGKSISPIVLIGKSSISFIDHIRNSCIFFGSLDHVLVCLPDAISIFFRDSWTNTLSGNPSMRPQRRVRCPGRGRHRQKTALCCTSWNI